MKKLTESYIRQKDISGNPRALRRTVEDRLLSVVIKDSGMDKVVSALQ